MLSKITGVNLLGYVPQTRSAVGANTETHYIQKSVAHEYSLSHPRANDSEGVYGESPLAKHLDLIS